MTWHWQVQLPQRKEKFEPWKCYLRGCPDKHGPRHDHCFSCERKLPVMDTCPKGWRIDHCCPWDTDCAPKTGDMMPVPREEQDDRKHKAWVEAGFQARPVPHPSMPKLEAWDA